MVDGRLLRWCTAKYLGFPSVEMTVKVDNRDWTICTVNRSEKRKHDSVVTPQGDNSRMMLPISRDWHQRLTRERIVPEWSERGTMKKFLVPIFDLLNSKFVVVRGNRNIAAIDNLESGKERVHLERHVVAPIECKTTRPGTDARRTEPSPRTVRGAGILRGRRSFQLVPCGPNLVKQKVHRLTKGAPMKATSKDSALSFPRH